MSRISLADGTLRGRLTSDGALRGQLNSVGTLRGSLTTPQVIQREMDYEQATNKPAINEHVLRAGENTLQEIGLDSCSFSDIDALFA